MKNTRTGVIHGRFQIPHNGHMEYLLEGMQRCDYLYVGITNPDPGLTAYNQVDPKRSLPKENPFTYFERLEMLRDSLLEYGIDRAKFEIVPFPINYPELLKYYVPTDAVFFVTIYDEWGETKLKELQSLGFEVDLMWKRSMDERLTTGKTVRRLIASDKEWEYLVPKSVFKYIKENKLDLRLKNIFGNENP